MNNPGLISEAVTNVIISASRRTDLPAFHAEWFMERVRAGFCTVRNPRNSRQESRISLLPEDVEVICFWTRNPRPLIRHLDELDQRGYRYYFLFTVLDNPRFMEASAPTMKAGVRAFGQLVDRIGPERVTWRYDPIVFTVSVGGAHHEAAFSRIAASLRGKTHRVVVSFLDRYAKVERSWKALREPGQQLVDPGAAETDSLASRMAEIATEHGMEIFSCAEEIDLRPAGIRPGKCIDDAYIERVFGVGVSRLKDPSQRRSCGCVVSRDIGAYGTCPFHCAYCYAK